MSDEFEKERELTKSLLDTHCPRCHVKGSLQVEKEHEGDEIVFTLICTEDGCKLREKGVRL